MTIGFDILTGEKISFTHDRQYKGKNVISFPDDYCVIDIETTGLSPDWDSIIEIAAAKFHKGNLVDTFTSLIKIQMILPPSNSFFGMTLSLIYLE